MTTTTQPPAYSAAAILRVSAIEELLAAGRLDEALDLAQASVAAGLVHARLYGLAAFRLEDQGRYLEAAMELGRGLALEPSNVELVTSLGFCLLKLGRSDALQMFRVAVHLDPMSQAARFGLGSALKAEAALDEAADEFRHCLLLNPTHAHALAELADLAYRRGDVEQARSCVQQALTIDPENGGARVIETKLALADRDFAAAEAGARRILEQVRLDLHDAADIRLALGDALDGLDRPADAFAAYAQAKSEIGRAYQPTFEAPGRESACATAERALAAFLATPGARWARTAQAGPPGPARGHAFLIGFPRSGTTLLETVLAGHADVVTLEERPTLIDAEAAFMVRPGGLEQLAEQGDADLDAFRQAYWRRVAGFGVDPTAKVFIDKQPLGALMAPVIAKLFPDARILFAVRDPRDVVFSCFRRNFKMNLPMYEFTGLERTARFYDVVMRSQSAFFERLPLQLCEIRYERLVEDFDAEVKAACAFLDLEWSDALRDFTGTARTRTVRSRSSNQVTEGLNRKGVAQWRRYQPALAPVLPVLKPWVERFGYAP